MTYGDSVIDNIIMSEFYQKNEQNRIHEIFKKRISNIYGTTYQDKLNTLNQCTCCIRHSTNRPSILQPWYELPTNYNNYSHHQCKCHCRQTARMICRYIYT